jgi:hypothetical protein
MKHSINSFALSEADKCEYISDPLPPKVIASELAEPKIC